MSATGAGGHGRAGMPAEELLRLLRCPETLQALRPAPEELLARVNRERPAARSGAAFTGPIAHGLVREDGAVLYRIDDGIPVLLIEMGISLSASLEASQLHADGDRV